MKRMPAMIEESLLILSQAVVVLVVRRGKRRAHHVEFRVGGTPVAGHVCGSVLVLGTDWDQPMSSSRVLPSGVRSVMCACGVEPLKNLRISVSVCSGGLLRG